MRRFQKGGVELIGALIIIGVMATGVGTMSMLSSGSARVMQDQLNAIEGFYGSEVAATHLFVLETANQPPAGAANVDGSFNIPSNAGDYYVDPGYRVPGGKPALPTGHIAYSAPLPRALATVSETEAVAPDTGSVVRRLETNSFKVLPKGFFPDPNMRCGEISYRGRGTTHRMCLRTVTARKLVSAGILSGCGINGGSLKCWGSNLLGELGNNGVGLFTGVPQQVVGMTDGVEGVSVAFGHACAIRRGAAFCWGLNLLSASGPAASFFGDPVPVPVTGLDAGVTSISTGFTHSCAVMDGGAYCWGSNILGNLGRPFGSPLMSATPLLVPGLETGVTEISAGFEHTCAIQNGAAVCWGSNVFGELGIGAITGFRAVPTQVVGLEQGVSTISAGMYYSCASGADGAYCWGGGPAAAFGALGTGGVVVLQPTPTPVVGGKRYISISTGETHSCGSTGAETECWGANPLWAFGSVLPPLAYAPVSAAGLVNNAYAESVSAGTFFSCSHDGLRARCAGINVLGQLGLGMNSPMELAGFLDLGILP